MIFSTRFSRIKHTRGRGAGKRTPSPPLRRRRPSTSPRVGRARPDLPLKQESRRAGGEARDCRPRRGRKEESLRQRTPARGLPATSPPATLQISSVIPHGPTRPLNPRCRRHSPRTLAAPRRPRVHTDSGCECAAAFNSNPMQDVSLPLAPLSCQRRPPAVARKCGNGFRELARWNAAATCS